MISAESIAHDLEAIRLQSPLVHNITNYVVMNYTANVLLALGASPVMAHAIEEVRDMAQLASSLVLNIGTLSAPWIESMNAAASEGLKRRIPIVLDPVGSGATKFRTSTSRALFGDYSPMIVRGNASEIASLHEAPAAKTKGVDSTMATQDVVDVAIELAQAHGSVVVASGAVDLITDGTRVLRVGNGHHSMTKVTGMGCAATSVIGAFAAVQKDPFVASAHAMALVGIAGEMAHELSRGPGSMAPQFIDLLASITQDDISSRLRIEP